MKSELMNDRFLLIATVLAGLLLFSNLSDGLLWQDEAETAIVAENVFRWACQIDCVGRSHTTRHSPPMTYGDVGSSNGRDRHEKVYDVAPSGGRGVRIRRMNKENPQQGMSESWTLY